METETLERACAVVRGVLAGLAPEDDLRPTPCALWDVRTVVNHIVDETARFALCMTTGAAPDHAPHDCADAPRHEVIAIYDATTAAVVAAFSAEGAQDQVVRLPTGPVAAPVLMTFIATGLFVHAWDVARATGQPTDLDPDLARHLLGEIRPLVSDALRGPEGEAPFAPATTTGASAPPADQLAAFLGRAT